MSEVMHCCRKTEVANIKEPILKLGCSSVDIKKSKSHDHIKALNPNKQLPNT